MARTHKMSPPLTGLYLSVPTLMANSPDLVLHSLPTLDTELLIGQLIHREPICLLRLTFRVLPCQEFKSKVKLPDVRILLDG